MKQRCMAPRLRVLGSIVAASIAGLGCATSGGPDLAVRALEVDGVRGATEIPTVLPLRDLEWNGESLVGIAGEELIELRPGSVGEVGPYKVWDLPEGLRPRPVLAVDADRVWLVDEHRLRLFRVRLGEPLQVEEFVLPGELEGSRFVDLEWDARRQWLWAVERVGHRVLALSVDENAGSSRVERRFGGLGREPSRFNVPLDAAVDESGTLWVLDSLNRRLVQVDPETSSVLRVLGGDDLAHRNMLPRPRAMCVDSHGDPWVYDDARGEVVHFDLHQGGNREEAVVESIALPAAATRLSMANEDILVGQPLSTRVLKLRPRR